MNESDLISRDPIPVRKNKIIQITNNGSDYIVLTDDGELYGCQMYSSRCSSQEEIEKHLNTNQRLKYSDYFFKTDWKKIGGIPNLQKS